MSVIDNIRLTFLYIEFYSMGKTWVYPESYIPYNIFRYIAKGKAEFCIDGEEIIVKENQIVYIPQGCRMSCRALSESFEFYSLRFTTSVFYEGEDVLKEYYGIPRIIENEGEDYYFKEICKWVKKDSWVKKCFVRGYLDLLIGTLSMRVNKFDKNTGKVTEKNENPVLKIAKRKEQIDSRVQLVADYVVLHPRETGENAIQSLFSVGNGTNGNQNRHFHIYVTNSGGVGMELRNTDGDFKYTLDRPAAVRGSYKGERVSNTIAFKADKENKKYKLFADGELIATLDKEAFKFISDITGVDNIMLGGTLRQGQVAYPFEGTINSVGVYQDVISDDELVQLTGQTTYADNIFYAGDATKSNYFRIPSLLTLDSGTVIAAADARYGGTHDSKSKINTAFAKSTDGGNTWGEPTLPMKFDDYVAKNIDWPRDSVGKNVQIQGSASYIDPVLLEDKSTHRVFLFADLMPAGIGSSNASVGSGFKEINGKKYLKLHWKDDSSSDYNYSIRENGIIYDDTTNASTEYSVDGEYNLYKNGEALTCKQYDYNFEGTSLLETPTDTDVNMNVFYKDSMFKVFPTNYLAMKYSDDEGDNWSDLNIVSTFKPEESKFLVLGPGIGKQITTGENAGRLIVPLYSKSSAELGFMYSDDHGNSWNYVEADHNTGGATAEAQIVEMPDGSLKTYLRTGSGYIAEVTSIDGGETWSDRVPLTEIATTSYGTQLSVINYSQPIDGKPAIILSAPNATNGRKNGKIWIGLINETGQSGVNKYSVEWKYCYSVDTPQMGYSYSCLTELPDGKVGLLYEKYDSWSRNELHLKNILKYEKFTIDELKVQP